MMKVLLISANTEQINMPVLPLGMAYVAAAAQSAGHDIETLNLMMVQNIHDRIKAAMEEFKPDLIGISVRNIDDQMAERPGFLLEKVKAVVAECRNLSGVPIVLGGAGYSIFPKSALAYLGADMGIQGEGEKSFVMLLDRLEQKTDLSGIPGLCLAKTDYREKCRFTRNLDELPQPLPKIHIDIPTSMPDEEVYLPVQTRRGCPMNCSYCSTATIEGRILRKHSVDRVMAFIRRYVDVGFERFFFVDNTFNFPLSYAKALCDRMIAAGLNIKWRCILYPWKIDDELVAKMAAAGCKEVALGFESGSEPTLKGLNKKFKPEDIRRISVLLGKQGIHRMGFLLLGGPGETRESVERSLYFAESLEIEAMKVTTGIRIYPGTHLHRIAVHESVVAPDDDLLFPKFYIAEGLAGWLEETVTGWIEQRPNWMK